MADGVEPGRPARRDPCRHRGRGSAYGPGLVGRRRCRARRRLGGDGARADHGWCGRAGLRTRARRSAPTATVHGSDRAEPGPRRSTGGRLLRRRHPDGAAALPRVPAGHRADADGLPLSPRRGHCAATPLDPDYRYLWPDGAVDRSRPTMHEGRITSCRSMVRPGRPRAARHMTPAEASLAVEQVVRTVAGGHRTHCGDPVPAAGDEPDRPGARRADVRAAGRRRPRRRWRSSPCPSRRGSDGRQRRTVHREGSSATPSRATSSPGSSGRTAPTASIQQPTIAGWEDRLFPFEVTFDLTDVAPGDYVVISQTDDPSGEGRFHVDTRRITVVD